MPDKIEVTVTHQFKASAERVYDAWLDPDKARIWQSTALKNMGLSGEMKQVEIDPVVGGKFLFSDMRDGVEAKHWGTYLELDRPNRISYTWNTAESDESDPLMVNISIEPEGEGCRVTLVQEMDNKWADYVERAENGWNLLLQACADTA